ncbi:peptidase M19 (plasmid) [Pseudosulfitobacter pseudonitzschiae]|uniref:Peptidase M19 n=1 Tax=Pseudosulfitobacter pseudonitzschiae TaxID=1402135 RepID=A0A221K634_9RHOB|nr:peptidase M19 [Pseudosulfitobacter pseudonitzschiae]
MQLRFGRLNKGQHRNTGTDEINLTIPAAGFGMLRSAQTYYGYDDALLTKLCHENWFSVLERTWKPAPNLSAPIV